MNGFDAVRTMPAVRQSQEKPVPEDLVHRILEAGRLSASAMNKQPWHIVVVQDRETLRQLGALARTGPSIAQAPLAIVVAENQSKLAGSDASRAIQSVLLTAWSEGVGGNWGGFGGLEAVGRVLAVRNNLEVLAILAFGYPAGEVGRGEKERKPLAEVARRGGTASRSRRAGCRAGPGRNDDEPRHRRAEAPEAQRRTNRTSQPAWASAAGRSMPFDLRALLHGNDDIPRFVSLFDIPKSLSNLV